jgi:hypothetical protein
MARYEVAATSVRTVVQAGVVHGDIHVREVHVRPGARTFKYPCK